MEDLIHALAENISMLVNLLAILAISIGAIQGAARLSIPLLTNADEDRLRPAWLAFGRWLVLGLTFQLAADIIDTTLAPGWDDVGKLGAIAVIRTFLNYFLNKDMGELRERAKERPDAVAERGPR